ncbi:hypothetical protein SETIT_1G362400v2 [Setaria italica]|uniref:Uncharacterized protein n=1 Tax=Setaria italica TaxID=4555 RepID=A0A368PSW7_SETIT|nr:hypothetical protein SETIT_1G362400v2 [Setaria italica]
MTAYAAPRTASLHSRTHHHRRYLASRQRSGRTKVSRQKSSVNEHRPSSFPILTTPSLHPQCVPEHSSDTCQESNSSTETEPSASGRHGAPKQPNRKPNPPPPPNSQPGKRSCPKGSTTAPSHPKDRAQTSSLNLDPKQCRRRGRQAQRKRRRTRETRHHLRLCLRGRQVCKTSPPATSRETLSYSI